MQLWLEMITFINGIQLILRPGILVKIISNLIKPQIQNQISRKLITLVKYGIYPH